MNNIFIVGSKGIPARYGGFETFVDKLTFYKKSNEINYHVSCLCDNNEEFIHNDSRCFNVKTPEIGSGRAVVYDVLALRRSIKYIKQNKVENPIIYILACRIGPVMWYYKKQLKKLNCKVYVNPDGHEWKRSKWNAAIRWYWKVSEKYMVKHADLLICDSLSIEKYIKEDYKKFNPKTTFIAYGADILGKEASTESVREWYGQFDIKEKEYYLIVGRFVPENNYETMIKEFMKSSIQKDLVIITNHEGNKLYEELNSKLNFENDKRIKFVGTVYDQELLYSIRKGAYGYLHGHEVGGTNPSLLEALAVTDLNLLLDVGFNREVGLDGAVYFSKEEGNLAKLLEELDLVEEKFVKEKGKRAKRRISRAYTWDYIVDKYESLFLDKEDRVEIVDDQYAENL